MTASRRVRTALLRLAAPFRRRHPVVLAHVESITERSDAVTTVHYAPAFTWQMRYVDIAAAHARAAAEEARTVTDAAYVAERDPSDEAGA